MRRRLKALRAAALTVMFVAAAAGQASAAEAPNPAKNIPIGALPSSCSVGTSAGCENAVIYYLNQARASLGLPAYSLPADFPQLPPDRQIFILSNLDRIAYSELPVAGLNAELSVVAAHGVAIGEDPGAYGWSYSSNGYSSNWDGGDVNAPAAYYDWMYNDGFGSGNLACKTPSSSGCWGHREDILFVQMEGGEYEAAMGAAAGEEAKSKDPGYAMLILLSSPRFSPQPPYYYTWADALEDGAGTYPYDPGVPDLSPPESHVVQPHLRVNLHGSTLRIRGGNVLRGRAVEVTVRREAVPCAIRLGASRCTWVRNGAIRRMRPILSGRTAIHVRPPSAWERVVVRVGVRGFESEGRRYAASAASLLLSGPKPHHFAR